MALKAAENPDESFPNIFEDPAELEGAYRFMSNSRVTPKAMLEPHVKSTLERAGQFDECIVAHDTTEFNFGTVQRKGLGRVGQGKSYGFLAHFSLAIAPSEAFEPLGVVGVKELFRSGSKKKSGKGKNHKKRQSDPTNEGLRWIEGVRVAEERLNGVADAIHVMDREGDSYALLAGLIAAECRFVVRATYNRATVGAERAGKAERIKDCVNKQPILATRTVQLSKREKSSRPHQDKIHPPRAERTATLSISAARVTISRPSSSSERPERTLTLNVVRVLEQDPPEGEQPVEWLLWTTEPIETEAQLLRIVDIYRGRWVIEEYFKVLKTGCSYKKRQFESADGLLRALAFFIPIAWNLLRLRTLSQTDAQTPADIVLSSAQLNCLAIALADIRIELPPIPTVSDALRGIAKLGGHLKHNGPPGWIVLLRGFEKLLLLERGFLMAAGHRREM